MNACSISLETLLNYLEQRLSTAESKQVEQHLARGCASCSAQRSYFEALRNQLRESSFEAPSSTALDRANQLLRLRRPPVTLREWAARLVVPLPPPLTLALRDASSEPVPLLFETEAHDIDLWAEPEGTENYYVIGQIRSRESGLAEQPLFVRVLSLSAPEQEQIITPDPSGEFHINSLPGGSYALVVCLATGTIRLDEVVLASRP